MSLPKINLDENHYLQGYKIRLYPNKSEAEFIEKCINTNRFVYNWVIEQEKEQYELYKAGLVEKEESFLSVFSLDKRFTELRNSEGYEFLKEIPHNSGRSAIRHAVRSFEQFFSRNSKYPKYKSKKNYESCSYKTRSDRMFFDGKYLRIEGLEKHDMIKTGYNSGLSKNESRKIKFINPIISKDNLGRYFISFNIKKKKPLSYFDDNNIEFSEEIGIDLNKNKRAVLSNGTIYYAPNYRKELKRIRQQEKIVRRDYKRRRKMERANPSIIDTPMSNKSKKRLYKLRKLYNRLHNINENFVEETTTKIIKSRPKAIVVEHIDVQNSIMNKHFIAKQMQFCNFYNFKVTLRNKADKFGIKFIEADQYFPSSQICSSCGNITKIPLGKKYINVHYVV